MQTQTECYPCILRMLETVANRVLGQAESHSYLADVRARASFQPETDRRQAPLIVAEGWAELIRRVGDADPLAQLKADQNALASRLLPTAEQAVADAEDPLQMATTIAIIGNSLDVLVPDQSGARVLLERLASARVDESELDEFRRRVACAHSIVYLGDNCGEIVFDRLLIETLRRLGSAHVVFVARALPVLNDATVADALAVGLGEVARVIGNGTARPMPGTLLTDLGAEARGAIGAADLIISKGGGNYELLGGDAALQGRITFLVDGKCDPLCREHGRARGMPILRNE